MLNSQTFILIEAKPESSVRSSAQNLVQEPWNFRLMSPNKRGENSPKWADFRNLVCDSKLTNNGILMLILLRLNSIIHANYLPG